MKKYTALTLGPISASLAQAYKAREIWAASFLFSHLMEKVIKHLLENKVTERQFILPYPKVRQLSAYNDNPKLKRAGVFPDQLILESDDGLFDTLQKAVGAAVATIAADTNTGIDIDYLKKYLRADIIEFEADPNEADLEKNVIFRASKYLANCELQNKVIAEDDMLFTQFLEGLPSTPLFQEVFGEGQRAYPSILEIGIRKIDSRNNIPQSEISELEKKGEAALRKAAPKTSPQNWDGDDKLLAGLKASDDYKDKLKTAHKYIAIVQADVDNLGKLIKSIYAENQGKIQAFQKALATFSLKASATVTAYGGEPVYAGGDDLLFFAPVVTPDSNIIKLLLAIDENLQSELIESKEFADLIGKLKKKPSMSYGVSITYYKYPMAEALKAAKDLLFQKAKKGSKNAIAYRLQKHSGQSFDDVLDKGSDFFKAFADMLELENLNLISSLLYNLEKQKLSLKEIIDKPDRLKAFFKNTYNKDIHKKDKATKKFIKKVRKLLLRAYAQTGDIDTALEKVYAALRFIKFINREHHA